MNIIILYKTYIFILTFAPLNNFSESSLLLYNNSASLASIFSEVMMQKYPNVLISSSITSLLGTTAVSFCSSVPSCQYTRSK